MREPWPAFFKSARVSSRDSDFAIVATAAQLALDEDALIDIVRSNLAGQVRAAEAGVEVVQRHIAALDGRFAADRLVDAFDDVDVPVQRLAPSAARRAGRGVGLPPRQRAIWRRDRRHCDVRDAKSN